jgi:hypothetical protein
MRHSVSETATLALSIFSQSSWPKSPPVPNFQLRKGQKGPWGGIWPCALLVSSLPPSWLLLPQAAPLSKVCGLGRPTLRFAPLPRCSPRTTEVRWRVEVDKTQQELGCYENVVGMRCGGAQGGGRAFECSRSFTSPIDLR